MSALKFGIVGTGGVGGLFGAHLFSGNADVRFVARGKHLEAMRTHGMIVRTPQGVWRVPADRVHASPREAGPVDVVLVCVKSYDTEETAQALGPMVHDNTIVISLQNGVDNEERIRPILPRGSVLGGVAYVYATITAPGEITDWGGPRKIVFGTLAPHAVLAARGKEICETMTGAGVDAEFTEDCATALWKKFIFITAVGGMTALTRLTLGEILAVEESRELLRAAMAETAAVSRAERVTVEKDFLDDTFEKLKLYDNNLRSSLYNDLVNGNRLEIEALSGTVVRIGRERGVPTPVHSMIYAALLPYHRAALRRSASQK